MAGRSPPPAGSRGTRRALAALALAAALLLAAVAPAAAAPAEPADTTLVVALEERGDARVTLQLALDGSTAEDRRALERLRENRSAVLDAYVDGVAGVAAEASAETGRPMSVADPTMRVEPEAGLVELSVTWRGLAAVEGDRLRVAAPFDDGFQPPGRFVVRAPEGYVVEAAAPEPTAASSREASWAAGTSLDGFATTVSPAPGDGASRPMSGFGVPAALLALALAAGVAALGRRRRR